MVFQPAFLYNRIGGSTGKYPSGERETRLKARLCAMLLAGKQDNPKTPSEIVQYMCAMQAQEYDMAKWAVGLRLPTCTSADVEEAFQTGQILRTHVLRPTWHFVHPNDIRWLIMLTAPTVHAKNQYLYKKAELDARVFSKSCAAIERALENGPRTRAEIQQQLAAAGIEAQGQRLSYIMMYAELEGLVASGPRRGRQFTYALMDAVAPKHPDLNREEMLALLSQRYFSTRSPATAMDFAHWSGLTFKEAKRASQMLGNGFIAEKTGEAEYIISEEAEGMLSSETDVTSSIFLLPDYDEYISSYKNRAEIVEFPEETSKVSEYSHWLVINGMIAGIWKLPERGGDPLIRTFGQTEQIMAGLEFAKLRYRHFQGALLYPVRDSGSIMTKHAHGNHMG